MQAIFLAVFLLAGEFKADPRLAWLPFDLTVATAVVLCLFVGYHVLRLDVRFQKQLALLILGLALFAIPLLWTVWTDYAVEKSSRMFTLTLLACAAPLLLVRDRAEAKTLLKALTVIALVIAGDALFTLWREMGTLKEESRLTGAASNTIILGRLCGIGLIGILMFRGMKPWVRLLLKGAALLVLVPLIFASGSRGPLIAIIVTLALFFLLFNARTVRQWLLMILAGGVFAAALVVGSYIAPEGSRSRMQETYRSDPTEDTRESASAAARLQGAKISIKKIIVTPLGTGWGGFAGMAQELGILYPHDLILEVFLEGGWIPGALMCAAFVMIFRKAGIVARRSGALTDRWVFLLAVFMFVNSLASGDFNDNRLLFAMLAVASTLEQMDGGLVRKTAPSTPRFLRMPKLWQARGVTRTGDGSPDGTARHGHQQ